MPADHKCFRMHGHSYRIEVTLEGEVDPQLGWLVDFGEVRDRIDPIFKSELDHRVLDVVNVLSMAIRSIRFLVCQ